MIFDLVRRILKPKDNIGITDWAEKHIILGQKQPTAFHGRYKGSRTPYMREIHEHMVNPSINHITMCFGAQTGKTLNGTIIPVLYYACEDPAPMIIAFPNERLAQSRSESSIMVMVEDSAYVRETLLSPKKTDFKKLEYIFKTCVINLIGGNSPANMSSRPARIVFIEEADKFPDQTKKEAKAINLLRERTKSFWNKKTIENSTPTVPNAHMWQAFLDGTQHLLHVPCPSCGLEQAVEFEDLDCPLNGTEYISQEAKWKCRGCKTLVADKKFRAQVKKARWIATAEAKDPKHVSYRLPAWYAQWVTFEDVFLEFNRSKDISSELQNFVNSWCAKAYTQKPIESMDDNQILQIHKDFPYPKKTIPLDQDAKFIVYATVDVQKSHLPFSVWATTPDKLFLIDFGSLSVIDDVALLKSNAYKDRDGNVVPVRFVLLDTGYRTVECYRFAIGKSWLIPIKGEQGRLTTMTQPLRVEKIVSMPDGSSFGKGKQLYLHHIHPRFFKDELTDSVNNRESCYCPIYFCDGIHVDDFEYVKQITGEVVMEEEPDKYGFVATFYKKVYTNDYFDVAQYAYAARHMMHQTLSNLKKQVDNKQGTANVLKKQGEENG